MSRNTTSFARPESMRGDVSGRVRAGGFGNPSEYLRDLTRTHQHEQAARRLRRLIADGLESGDARPVTDEVLDERRRSALDADR